MASYCVACQMSCKPVTGHLLKFECWVRIGSIKLHKDEVSYIKINLFIQFDNFGTVHISECRHLNLVRCGVCIGLTLSVQPIFLPLREIDLKQYILCIWLCESHVQERGTGPYVDWIRTRRVNPRVDQSPMTCTISISHGINSVRQLLIRFITSLFGLR